MSSIQPHHLDELRRSGFVKIGQFFASDLVARCRAELEAAVAQRQSTTHILTSASSVHVHNFFLYGPLLRRLLFGPELQVLHKRAFGPNYCLRNAVASTIQLNSASEENPLHHPIGAGWHRDTPQFHDRDALSRVIGSECTYQVIVALDPSDAVNSTKLLGGSHRAAVAGHKLSDGDLELLMREPGLTDLLMAPGDVAVIDDNTFHKAGLPTSRSRWMLFCSYTPWFVKPYFDFTSVELPDMTAYEAHCLHRTSMPPDSSEPLRNTFRSNDWEKGV
jgi:hypothetical protein